MNRPATPALRDVRPSRCCLVLLLLACACTGKTAAAPDVGVHFPDTSIVIDVPKPDAPDVIAPQDTIAPKELPTGDVPAADAPPDIAIVTDVASVHAAASATAVEVAAKITMTVQVTLKNGQTGDPAAKHKVQFRVGDQVFAAGAVLAPDAAKQPGLSVWKGATLGQYFVTGVRPGKSELVVEVDGVASETLPIDVSYPTDPILRLTLPTAEGKTPGDRIADANDTVRIEGKTFGAGGLTLTIRFPIAAVAGTSYDTANPPAVGGLLVTAVVADLGGLKLNLVTGGRLWIDQVDKGLFRGCFLGTSADLKPMAGVFVVERDGKFGIDVLDDPQTIETSSAPDPAPGVHVSRAVVSAVGGGKALLTYRRINDVTKADLVRVLVDAKSGALDTSLAPAVTGASTGTDPNNLLPALGYASAALSETKVLVAWEGKKGKGLSEPNQIWVRPADTTHAWVVDAPVLASGDDCSGLCRPQVLRLPSSRWLVLWSAPGGQGIKARRYQGTTLDWAEALGPKLIVQPPGTGARAAVLDANIGLTWFDPSVGSSFRLFTDGLSSIEAEQPLGDPTQNVPWPAMVAVNAPSAPSFMALFFGGTPATDLKFRRIDLSAKTLGPADMPLTTSVDWFATASGKNGQVAVIERASDDGTLRARKILVSGPADNGSQLGATVTLATKPTSSLVPSICYVVESDIFVVTWSGDSTSDNVQVLRFR